MDDTPAALESAALDGGVAATPPLPDSTKLRPFQPDLQAVSGIERALRAAAGDGGWERVARSLGPVLLAPPPTANECALARAGEAFSAALRPDPTSPLPSWVGAGAALGRLVEDLKIPEIYLFEARIGFCAGLVEGAADGILEELQAQVRLIGDLLGGIVDFYSVVYDANVLSLLFQAWFVDPVGTPPPTELESVLRADYPGLWQAIVNARPVIAGLNQIVAQIRDEESDGTGAAVALRAIGDWIARLPETLGASLRPHLDKIVDAQGDPKEQGEIIGRVAAPVVLNVVMTAIDLANLARHAVEFFAKLGPLVFREAGALAREAADAARLAMRQGFSAEELESAAAKAKQVAPAIAQTARDMRGGVLRQLSTDYGELGYRIAPYRINSRQTGAWNKAARDFAGLTTKDAEYAISLRLDSNHIIEDEWFDKFPDEFRKAFKDWAVLDSRGNPVIVDGKPLVVSWQSAKDMDAFAIHTEAHIRSGTRMAEQGLLGAAGHPPLNPEMDAFFARYRADKLGGREFANLREVFEAHKRFFQEERTSTLWPRLSAWFARADGALVRAGF
jgi:hypothetical protein